MLPYITACANKNGAWRHSHAHPLLFVDKIILVMFCILDPILTLYAKYAFPWINEYNPIFDMFTHNLLIFAIALVAGKALYFLIYRGMVGMKYFNVIRGIVLILSLLVVTNNFLWILYYNS